MKILINLSSIPLSTNKNKRNYSDYIIYSQYMGAETLSPNQWFYLGYEDTIVKELNKCIWMINFARDNNWRGFDDIESIEIKFPIGYQIDDLISDQWILEVGTECLEKPLLDHYFADKKAPFNDKDSIRIWLGKINKDIKKIVNKDKNIKRKYQILTSEYDGRLVGIGNEGYIVNKNNILTKYSVETNKLKKNEASNIYGCEFSNSVDSMNDYYLIDVLINKSDVLSIKYPNVFYPTEEITYPYIANSLIRQHKMKILIDDSKPENYAKYFVNDDIFRVDYSDLGKSFIVVEDSHYDRNFMGVVRDGFQLVKNSKHIFIREKIRDMRNFSYDHLMKDIKFKKFVDFVYDGYKSDAKNRRACELNELPSKGRWLFCSGKVNTLTKVWSSKSSEYLDLTNIYKDSIIKCNCETLLSQVTINTKIEDAFALDQNLVNTKVGVFVNFGPKIIALMATSGERDFSKAIKSIESQSLRVDEIIIASEIELSSRYRVFVNPYDRGLSKNTMQALSILRSENNDEIFIATIDDDDEWKEHYIKDVYQEILNGYNFIGTGMEVLDNGKRIDSYVFETEDMNVKGFVRGNCGIQGSNKVFNLNLALESGGMYKGSNTSTDRSFNIRLLEHPNVKPKAINKLNAIFNKDSDRDRISNSKNKLIELRKFYRSIMHLLDEEDIFAINERHKKLHKLDEVIIWR